MRDTSCGIISIGCQRVEFCGRFASLYWRSAPKEGAARRPSAEWRVNFFELDPSDEIAGLRSVGPPSHGFLVKAKTRPSFVPVTYRLMRCRSGADSSRKKRRSE